MNLFKTENENRDFFLNKLKQDSVIKNHDGYLIDKEIPVPYKHIYFPIRNELEICCFKQDICIYRKLFDKSIGHREAKITLNRKNSAPVLTVVLNKNARYNDRDIGLPFVTVETKMSENINTHELLSCSEKIRMIKTLFPYCRAYLLCFGDTKRRIYRLGSGFDEIIFLDNLSDEKCKPIIQDIAASFGRAWHAMFERA
jgi:hypothetical protein